MIIYEHLHLHFARQWRNRFKVWRQLLPHCSCKLLADSDSEIILKISSPLSKLWTNIVRTNSGMCFDSQYRRFRKFTVFDSTRSEIVLGIVLDMSKSIERVTVVKFRVNDGSGDNVICRVFQDQGMDVFVIITFRLCWVLTSRCRFWS